MNLQRHPELLDRLAAAYALGTLRGGARRRFETLARQSATVRAAALLWQERLAAMTELQAGQAPSPQVWTRIRNLLAAQQAAPAASGQEVNMIERLRHALGLWRGAALAGGLATVATVVVGLVVGSGLRSEVAQLQARPQVQYVAVLADDKATASMLVTFDPQHRTLTLKRVGGYQEAADRSLQLWALPAAGGPKSLGVLGGEAVIRLTAAEQQVQSAPAMAISLEPKGGVPEARGPTGPVLFKGAVLRTAL